MQVATTGSGTTGVLRVLIRSTRWTSDTVTSESDHRHADRLMEEFQSGKKQSTVTQTIRANGRKQEDESGRENIVGERTHPGRGGRPQAGVSVLKGETEKNQARRGRSGIGGETHPQASVGQAGAGRGGLESEDQPQSGPVRDKVSTGEPIAGEEATRYRALVARCTFLGCDRPDIQSAEKKHRGGCRNHAGVIG